MNRIMFLLAFLCTSILVSAQIFQGTIRPGSTSSSVYVAIRPSVNYSDKPSNVQFTIAVPQSVGARPAMNFTSSYSSLFSTSATFTNATYGTDYIYMFNMITPTLTTTKNYTANIEDIVAEVSFAGITNTSNIKLVQLPNGLATTGAGSENGNYNFYIEFAAGSDKTNQSQMFYSLSGGTVVNNPLGYAGYASVSAGSGVVALKWLNINVQKQSSNALVKWQVANADNTDYFDVEAGIDPAHLSHIGSVTSTAATNYTFTHINYNIVAAKNVYYRVKEINKEGKQSYSQLVKLSNDSKEFSFGVIGNPVTASSLIISIQSLMADKGTLTILDLHGKKMMQQNISWLQGTTQQAITIPTLAKGMYMVVLQVGDQQYQEKFVK